MNWKIIPDEQTPCIPPMEDVDSFLKFHAEELVSFLELASQQPTGVGLAANQCSLDGERFMHRVFALKNLEDKSWRLIVDPKITEYIGMKELKEEGCLTWIGKTIVAERYRKVKVSYYDANGNFIENELHKNFEGQIWQHEINHLIGIAERIEPGNFVMPSPQKKVGRNDSCPCGSGKKYKTCCL